MIALTISAETLHNKITRDLIGPPYYFLASRSCLARRVFFRANFSRTAALTPHLVYGFLCVSLRVRLVCAVS